jgi:hypothetical protein
VAEVEARIATHDAAMPVASIDPLALSLLASNLKTIWFAPTTDARLKKRIVRTSIHEVVADIDDAAAEDRSRDPLDGWRAQRDAPAKASPRSKEQHLRRCDHRCAPAHAHRK